MIRQFLLLSMCAAPGLVQAQNVISAKVGLVQVAEGDVRAGGTPIETTSAKFYQLAKDALLETGDGRAEVLVTPGSFLRIGEQSAMRVLSASLEDAVLEIVRGTALLEYGEFTDINSITIKSGGWTMTFSKSGLYELDLTAGEFRVRSGEATVTPAGGAPILVKEGRMLALNPGNSTVARFDKESSSALLRWSARRGALISNANIIAANRASSLSRGSWVFDPFLGSFTYFPLNRFYRSPWGFGFWHPGSIGSAWVLPVGLVAGRPGVYDPGVRGSVVDSAVSGRGYDSYGGGYSSSSSGGYSGSSGGYTPSSTGAPSSGGTYSGGSGSASGSGGGSGRGN
jgi:hypothetical protein